jgi:hypothetical protein
MEWSDRIGRRIKLRNLHILLAVVQQRSVARAAKHLWTIAVATFKSETYRFLRLAAPTDEDVAAGVCCPAGYVHLSRGILRNKSVCRPMR